MSEQDNTSVQYPFDVACKYGLMSKVIGFLLG